MTSISEELAAEARDEGLKRLLSYLAADPENQNLRIDAAERALSAGEPQVAELIFADASEALGDRELGLLGLARMKANRFDAASQSFGELVARGIDDPAIRFNLAWSRAMEKDFEGALEQLPSEVTATIPAAAMLRVQLLHQDGKFEQAHMEARSFIETFPDDPGLAAAVSILALDVEDIELAERTAKKGGAHPDALATLGILALGDSEPAQARALFDQALDINASLPRAWIGRGLAGMLAKDPAASADIDRGAELFGDHIGSWIAAGWSYLITGDLEAARARFERALAIDENFGESHGSLAVVDALEGKEQEARRNCEIALRLDPDSFSGRFAKTLLIAARGNPQAAKKLITKILETPVNDRGDTAAAALAKMGLGSSWKGGAV